MHVCTCHTQKWGHEKHGPVRQTGRYSKKVINVAFDMQMLMSEFCFGPSKSIAVTDFWVLEEGIS